MGGEILEFDFSCECKSMVASSNKLRNWRESSYGNAIRVWRKTIDEIMNYRRDWGTIDDLGGDKGYRVNMKESFSLNDEYIHALNNSMTPRVLLHKDKDICPLCGGELCGGSLVLENSKKERELSASSFVIQSKKSAEYKNVIDDKSKINIIEYMRHLVAIDANLIYLEKRLGELYGLQYDVSLVELRERLFQEQQKKNNIEAL